MKFVRHVKTRRVGRVLLDHCGDAPPGHIRVTFKKVDTPGCLIGNVYPRDDFEDVKIEDLPPSERAKFGISSAD